jgi:ADP-ribose diphosphatase
MATLGRPKEIHRRVLLRGRIFDVARCTLRFRSGLETRNDLVIHHGAAVFVPITARGGVLLVRQYRHAAGRFLWEIPAGRVERGERPLATAKRELAEECGLEARRWTRVAAFLPAPGYTTEVMHLYFARDLRPARGDLRPDHDEDIALKEVSRRDLARAIAGGKILDAKTIVAAFYLSIGR